MFQKEYLKESSRVKDGVEWTGLEGIIVCSEFDPWLKSQPVREPPAHSHASQAQDILWLNQSAQIPHRRPFLWFDSQEITGDRNPVWNDVPF